MLETDFTRLVGCTVPIQLAGMGAIVSPELAAAVSAAGALGETSSAPRASRPEGTFVASSACCPYSKGFWMLCPYLFSPPVALALREASPPYCKQARLARAWVLVSLRPRNPTPTRSTSRC